MLRNDALIIAHHHSLGQLRLDTIDLIQKVSKILKKVVLVSTNISLDQLSVLPNTVDIIIRENIGYDFASYRIGFLSLLPDNYDNIYMMNTSVVIVNYDQFENSVLSSPSLKNTVFGITKNYQITEHIQSYFYKFPSEVFNKEFFKNWWLNLIVPEHKVHIIYHCEVGLSSLMLSNNIPLQSVYWANDIRDLTQIDWTNVFNHTGIIKKSLITTNFHNVDILLLNELSKDYKIHAIFRQVLEE